MDNVTKELKTNNMKLKGLVESVRLTACYLLAVLCRISALLCLAISSECCACAVGYTSTHAPCNCVHQSLTSVVPHADAVQEEFLH